MATPGAAPAQPATRTLIGPLSTQAGFQYWYFVCLPDSMIAVRQSIGAFFALGISNGAVAPIFGLLGALINMLVKGHAQKFRARKETILQRTAIALLRAKPNVVYSVSQLVSITFKDVKYGGNLVLPDIILETRNGKKEKFGMQKAEFDKACAQLKQMYPNLCK